MSEVSASLSKLPPGQEVIRAKCFHPSGTFVEFPIEDVETSIPERFEKMVRMYSDQLAVKTARHAITYEELNAMANRWAHAILAERGNGPELIGMLLDKGVEQIAAMLAILKAGKFFILLDPSFPTERLSLVLEDSKTTLVLVDERTQSLVQQDNPGRCKLFRIDTLAHTTLAQDPRLPISPDALASIVYTSGSTGRPKGVVRNHRALLHGTMLRIHTDGISHKDRLAHITAGTSNSVTNSFYALLQGAALVAFDLKREGVARLAHWLIDEKISACLIASPVFRSLCTTLTGAERFPDLRYLRLRSDKVYSSDVARHRKHFPATCLLATGLSSSETGPLREFRITHDTELCGSEVPVGYALNDKEILLLNEDGREVGFNEIGEIVVRSEYLASGYWNDAELTAAKFKPDPQSFKKRMYYTGDLGQMLPDGCLIHKGRKDFRVKIRGYGVDLIEVEKALRSHGTIKDAVVIAKPGKSGDARLIAYYTSEGRPGVAADELRKFLGANLADYMIPSAFVKLDALPLTSNGKVDRAALPKLDHKRPDLKTPYVPPSTDIEKRLSQIWSGVLSVEQVGIHDNFFDLGGHSLLAAKLFMHLDDEFGRLFPLSVLFAAPTVHLLAEQYSSSTESRKMSPLVPLVPTGSLPPVYAVPGVFGNVVGFVDLSRELGAQQPFYALQSIGLDGAQTPLDSIEEMAKLYLSEIREIQSHGPYVLIGACFGARVAFEMTRQLHEADEEVAFLGLLDPIGLQRDKTVKNSTRVPPLINRAKALSRFFTDRLGLYFEELRRLDNIDRIYFIARKIRSLGFKIGDRRAIRSVQREFHQLEVFKASKIAGRQYVRKPLKGRLRALEIFESSHPRNDTKDIFDWTTLWQGHVVRHRVPGRDSSDMLIGENARVLAALLAQRLRAAFIQQSSRVDFPQSKQCTRPDFGDD